MRQPMKSFPKCEICGQKEATKDANVRFDGHKAAWCYCCSDCQKEYGTGAFTDLELRDPKAPWPPKKDESSKEKKVAAVAKAEAAKPKRRAAVSADG